MNIYKRFQVGLSIEALVYVPVPLVIPLPYQRSYTTLAGNAAAFGYPSFVWRYGFIEAADRQKFRNVCPGPSASVYVRSTFIEGLSSDFTLFTGTMFWPAQDDPISGQRVDWRVEFKYLVPVEE